MKRQEIEQGVKDFAIRQEVNAKITKAGLPIPTKPEDSESLYDEWERVKKKYGGVSNIPFQELGQFLDKWTGLVSYARWVEATADIDTTTAREVRDTIKKQLYTINEGSRELRDANVHVEPLYIQWEKSFTESVSMYIATKALREGYEKRADAISREITRRGSDVVDQRRLINRGQAT